MMHGAQPPEVMTGSQLREYVLSRKSNEIAAERDLLARYIGKNAEKYLSVFDKHADPSTKKKSVVSFNLGAFLFGFMWCFYRKLYVEGAVLVILPIVVTIVFPQVSTTALAGSIIGLMAVLSKSYYVEKARKRVKALQSARLEDQHMEAALAKNGGTSVGGAVLGVVLLVSMVVVSILAVPSGKLVSCDDPVVTDMLPGLVGETIGYTGAPSSLTVSQATAVLVAQDGDGGTVTARSCQATATLPSGIIGFDYSLTWADREAGQFLVQITAINP